MATHKASKKRSYLQSSQVKIQEQVLSAVVIQLWKRQYTRRPCLLLMLHRAPINFNNSQPPL